MAQQPFTIPKRAFVGFRVLSELGPEVLQKIAEVVAARELTLNLHGLAKELAQSVNFSSPDRLELAFTAVLMPLSELRSEFEMSEGEFINLLNRLIEKQDPTWHEEHKEDWAKVAPTVGTLIGLDSYFGLLQKAFRLVAARPAMATGINILTDLRPVYDEKVATVKAMILTSTLVIEYDEGNESKTLHLTLGQRGLQNLKDQVNRADKKSLVLEDQTGKLGVPMLVAGVDWTD